MKRILVALALSSFVLSPAYAGTVSDAAVSLGNNFATGSLKTARNAGDSNQYIGCYTYQSQQSDGGGFGVTCFARDAAGTYRSCVNDADTLLLQEARNISYRSYVFFMWDSFGICSYLYVQNSSDYQ